MIAAASRVAMVLLLALPATALGQGRCKDGEVEDPNTGNCKPASRPHRSGSSHDASKTSGPSEEDIEETANLERQACDVRCEQQKITCREDGDKCATLYGLCKQECDTRYLERLPSKRRREILKARDDEVRRKEDEVRHAAEEKQRKEQERLDELARLAQVKRADQAASEAEQKATLADAAASEGCHAARRMRMPEIPCSSGDAAAAVRAARIAGAKAHSATTPALASAAAELAERAVDAAEKAYLAALRVSEPARDAARRDDERIRAEQEEKRRVEQERQDAQRRAAAALQEVEHARAVAEQERLARAEELRQQWSAARAARARYRVRGYLLAATATVFAGLGITLLALESAQYNKIRAGGLATPDDITGAITVGHVLDGLAITSFIVAGVAAAIGVPMVLVNRDRGEYRVGLSASAGGAGLVLSGRWR